jgi:two-component system NarL family sensor kinase
MPATARLSRARGPALGGLCATISLAGLALAAGPGHRSLSGLLGDNALSTVVNAVTLGVLGGVLMRLRPGNRVGLLVLVIGWCNALTILGEGWALASYRVDLPGRVFFAWLGSWPWALGLMLGPTLLPLIYPGGRTVSRVARRLAALVILVAVALGAALALLDDAYASAVPGHPSGPNPISHGRLQGLFGAVAAVAAGTALLLGAVAWGHTLRRLWRAHSPEREQLAWLLAVVAPILLVAPLNWPWLGFVLQVLAPVGLLVGIVRHQLFDIKVALRSGLVYGGLTTVAVGAYVAVVTLIGAVTPSGTAPNLFAAATVGLVVLPAHHGLQRFVGRLVYGDHADPIRALTRVGDGIRSAGDDPSAVRPVLSGIARALRSPYVAVAALDGTPVASAGTAQGQPLHEVPLEYAGERVGTLTVAGRAVRDPLRASDRRMLAALAGPVAAAVRAGLMAKELGESRSRILAARESERRRLREDLHDGLGPALSGVALGLEAARSSMTLDPGRVPEILDVLHREVDCLVSEVRGIIDDLGPGNLDLLASLRGHVEALAAPGGVDIVVSHSGKIDGLPGEIAVAAARIAGEALTNAVRHAGATRISMVVANRRDRLTVEVADDGCGTVAPRHGGVGLSSMRQRAESVGGTLSIDATTGTGTRVLAALPLEA